MVITKEIEKTVLPDTVAQIFWLKNRRPDKWRDKIESISSSENDKTISININTTKKQGN